LVKPNPLTPAQNDSAIIGGTPLTIDAPRFEQPGDRSNIQGLVQLAGQDQKI
jgi:hypothetical protein